MSAEDPTGCFARLGLTPDADAREIKRAYAKQLKRIDRDTELERFAQLRSDYEEALAAAAQAQESPDVVLPLEDAFVPAAEEEPERSDFEVAEEASERSDSDPLPEPQLELPVAVSNDELLEQLARAAVFDSDNVPAAVMVLRKVIETEALTSLARRDAFEALLVNALRARRFGSCNGAFLLAADEVFGWRGGGAKHLADMGLPGAIITAALDEISQISGARLERMLGLAGEPSPLQALKLWKPQQPINPATPLASVLFPPGHLDKWAEAHARAPLAGRARLAFHRFVRSPATWQVAFVLLALPVVIGIFSVVSTRVGEEQVREASEACQRAFASGKEAGWKNMTLTDVAMVQRCAAQVPPDLCVDREGLLTVATLANRLFPSASGDSSLLSYYQFMPYGTVRLNLDDGRVFGAFEDSGCDGVESFLNSADWLAQGDEPAARKLIERAASCMDGRSLQQRSPALYTFLRHTDAWPATDGDIQKARYRLRELISQPRPVDIARTSAKLQSQRPWRSCRAS
jgi:hypothetical protein